jgi:hypothetical protein
VPIDWAFSLGNEGIALMFVAERRGDVSMAEMAASQITTALETMRDSGDPSDAAYYEKQLAKANTMVARLRGR